MEEYGLNLGNPKIQSMLNYMNNQQTGSGNSGPSASSYYQNQGEAYGNNNIGQYQNAYYQQQMYYNQPMQQIYPQYNQGYMQQQNAYLNQQVSPDIDYDSPYFVDLSTKIATSRANAARSGTNRQYYITPQEFNSIADEFNAYWDDYKKELPKQYFQTQNFIERWYSKKHDQEQIDALSRDRMEYAAKMNDLFQKEKKQFYEARMEQFEQQHVAEEKQLIAQWRMMKHQQNNVPYGQSNAYQQPQYTQNPNCNQGYPQQQYYNQPYQMPQNVNMPTHYSEFMPYERESQPQQQLPISVSNSYSSGQGLEYQNANPQMYYNNQPMYNSYGGYYDNNQNQETINQYNMIKDMYENGMIGVSEYAAYANAGFEHVTEDGTRVFADVGNNFNDSWGGGIGFGYPSKQELAYMKQQQEIQELHAQGMEVATRCVNKNLGIDPEKQATKREKYNRYMASVYAKRQKNAMIEAEQDAFLASIQNCVYSDQPGYMSSMKEQVLRHWNETWEKRHKGIPEKYTFEEFSDKGIFMDIMYKDREWLDATKRKYFCKLYAGINACEQIMRKNPYYDPVDRWNKAGFNLRRNDTNISLPPQLIQSGYGARRTEFFDKVGNGRLDEKLYGTTSYLDKVMSMSLDMLKEDK